MIFFATSALHVQDIVETEVRAAGGTEVRPTTGGVEFSGSLETGYTFCLSSRVSTRLLLGLWEHDDIQSADELYDASLQLPWEEWITSVDQTFQITHTVRNCPYLRNSKFGAIRVKDAIVDRLRDHFDGERPQVDTDESDLTFHLMVDGTRVAWFVDFSGRGLHRRGYRGGQTDAVMSEYVAAALLYRSPWLKAMQAAEDQVPPLFDPFCGSGTIVIEAALWALGRAPGLVSARNFNFLNLPIHDQELYDTVIAGLREQEEVASKRSIVLYGWDQDPAAVRIAQAAAEQAGVAHVIDFRVKALEDITLEDVPLNPGFIVTDPPYGIRLDGSLIDLYRSMSDQFQAYYKGWNFTIISGNPELLEYIDLKSDRTNTLVHGGIHCEVAHYYLFTDAERAALAQRAEAARQARLAIPLNPGAQALYNRLVKNIETLGAQMQAEGVTNWRLYDREMGEYNASIDLYAGRWAVIYEYEAPPWIEDEVIETHQADLVDATERAAGIDRTLIFVKQRRRQRGKEQYEKFANRDRFFIIDENEARYLVNFTDYLDTGIFLDHRPVRAKIATLAEGKRFLNLFSYTGTATVQAARGGAISTVSVDTSATYLEWAQRNMQLNGFGGMNHFYHREDVFDYLYQSRDRFDLIFCDPPTFSNSTGRNDFDVGRHHAQLIRKCMDHLDYSGTLIFSTNYRRFRLDDWVEETYHVEEITDQTIGADFQREEQIHTSYLITFRQKVQIPRPKRPKVVVKKR